ncbi:MAG: branched-chain amino acid ABC transporter permease, partial [Haloquadratum sp.]|nr:branched-chain amino acid ABC transporter permease [Haloquadratum sp.]
VPPALQLEFAVPLVFLALLGNSIDTTSKQIAAVVGATVAVLWALYNVQYNLGILVGAMVGVMAGVTWESVVEEGAHEDG